MAKYKVTVPPTSDIGSYVTIVKDSYMETVAQVALWDYNKVREHDGLPQLSRMPNGTKYYRI